MKATVLRESAAYVGAQGPRYGGGVSAESVGSERLWFGRVTIGPGDHLYIPASTSHLATNASATEPLVAIIARTDPNEQESVVLQPELDARVP